MKKIKTIEEEDYKENFFLIDLKKGKFTFEMDLYLYEKQYILEVWKTYTDKNDLEIGEKIFKGVSKKLKNIECVFSFWKNKLLKEYPKNKNNSKEWDC